MKKEFINPTMRFSFFSRENIVTDSATNVADANAALNDAIQGALDELGSGSASGGTSIKNIKLSDLKFTV